ncbi:MAG TPA: hypothetical protein ENK86_03685 [Campylobacterales bacterium]|nr:hypothetical protein [Campylobacterales bacterium]
MRILMIIMTLSLMLSANIGVYTSQGKKIMSISKSELEKLFLKKIDTINGIKVTPIDNSNPEVLQTFYKMYINKTPQQLHAYWAKQALSNNKRPPQKLADHKIAQLLSGQQTVIAYTQGTLSEGIRLTVR